MWDSIIEVLEIVYQDERNPSDASGFVEKRSVSTFVYDEDDVTNPPYHK
jgi:hypothetical protein